MVTQVLHCTLVDDIYSSFPERYGYRSELVEVSFVIGGIHDYTCFSSCHDNALLTRVPEIVFKGSEVWVQMEDEELLDVKDLLTWFVISSLIERVFHAFLEVGDWTC